MLSTSCRAGMLVSATCLILGASTALYAVDAGPSRTETSHLAIDGVPPPDLQLAARLARYQRSRQASFLDWLPDGSMLIATRFGEGPQVHRVAQPLGDREQLTFGAEHVLEARAQANGTGFVFLAEQADHSAQVYAWSSTAGSVRPLTPIKASRSSALLLSHEGKRVALAANARGVGQDIYAADLSGGAVPQLLTQIPGAWVPLDWSSDDQHLLALKVISPEESALYSLDTTGVATQLLPLTSAAGTAPAGAPAAAPPHKARIRTARYAPDGRGLYVLSDEGGEQQQLIYFDPSNGRERPVSPQLSWDVEDFAFSADGRYTAYVVNEDGISRLTVQDASARADLTPPQLPDGQITGLKFDKTGRRLAFTLQTAQQPADVYVYDVAHATLERWTHSEAGPLDPANLVQAELVHYPTWDRSGGHPRMLSAYLYRPRGAGPFPVLISIHGGPADQARPAWDPFVQFLVNELGVAVVAPNVRGSTGYGRSFAALDDGDLRQDAVRDIGSLLVWLGLQAGFDRQHIAVMGSGYGGYMALSSLAAYNDRLCGGIDVQGISDLASYLAGLDGPDGRAASRDAERLEYGDERDPHMRAYLDRISPLHNIAQIRAPLLVVQQATDAKGPPPLAQQMVWRLRSRHAEAGYVATKDGSEAYLPVVAAFLTKLLGGKATDTASP